MPRQTPKRCLPARKQLETLDVARSAIKLSGFIPTELGKLNRLTTWFMFDQRFSGTLPPEIGELNHLVDFNLGPGPPGNGPAACSPRLAISGTIPEELWGLPSLFGFNIECNRISGTIPKAVGKLGSGVCRR